MRTTASLIILFLCTILMNPALAEPDKGSLIDAWETYIRSLPGTVRLETIGDGVYQYEDTDLPYNGKLEIVGALVRSSETAGYETDFTHLGMVDFKLQDMPEERSSSQVYYYWVADRQTLHFSKAEQRWVDPATVQATYADYFGGPESFGALSFMLNYGIWVLLLGLLIFLFVSIGKQSKKARVLMDESASINQQASGNLDRAEKMQDEVLAIARESRDLHIESNKLLKDVLDTLKR